MADNISVTEGVGRTIATDDIGNVHHQKVKVEFGPSDTATQVEDTPTGRLPVGGGAIGAINETAPAADTDPAGLNGRLQRVCQLLTQAVVALGDVNTELGTVSSTLAEPATDIPHPALDASLDLTPVVIDFNTSGDKIILAGQAGKTIRLHWLVLTAASGLSTVLTLKNGPVNIPLQLNGPGLTLDDQGGRPYYVVAAGQDFVINSSAAGRVCGVAYVMQT